VALAKGVVTSTTTRECSVAAVQYQKLTGLKVTPSTRG